MKRITIEKDCAICLKRFEDSIDNLQKQIKDQGLIIQRQEEKIKKFEEQHNKDSHNSNKPPSSDNPFKKIIKSLRKKSGKKPGGQVGHKGTTLKKVENPDKIIEHQVKKCSCCGIDLSSETVKRTEKRQVFDIPPIKVEVTEHRAEGKDCPHCGTRVTAEFPEGVTNNVQYGKEIKTHLVHMKIYELIPYNRLSEYAKDILGVPLSKAAIEGFIQETYNSLQEYEQKVIELIIKELVVHFDETGIRIQGLLKWLHVASTERFTYYFPHDKRGAEAMLAMEILTRFTGIAIHDGWRSYLEFLCRHGLCNVHHLRELIWVNEVMGQEWAKEMGDLLINIKNDKETSFPIPAERMEEYDVEYDRIIAKGYALNPMPENQDVKRGRKKRGKVLCLLDRLKEFKESVLLFMREKDVPFGNNLAERDVRMTKVQQKISGTFRSWDGAKAFCRIRGYISTVKKSGGNVYQALLEALNGFAIKYATG